MDDVSSRPSSRGSLPESLKRWQSRLSHASTLSSDPQAQRVRAVATQAFLYVAVIIVVLTPAGIARFLEWMDFDDEGQLFPLLLLNSILWPLQGFFNCLIYVRPSYLHTRKEFPNESRLWCFRRALHGAKIQPTDDMMEEAR